MDASSGQAANSATVYDRAEVIARMREDFDFFCAVIAPEVCTSPFPEFFLGVFAEISAAARRERDRSKYAIGIPRAHAKTTFVKLVIAYLLLFSPKQYFLIVGSITSKASDIIADVMSLLDGPNCRALFGNWRADVDSDSVELKVFTFQGRKITIRAAAPGGSLVRGTSKNFRRPDFVLMDDIIDEKGAASPAVSSEIYLWLLGTLLLAGDPRNCQYVYLGNKYAAEGCILTKLEKSKDWMSLVVGALLADGEPLWPELHSKEYLLSLYQAYLDDGHPEIFWAELMNHVGRENRAKFQFDKVKVLQPEDCPEPVAKWLVIDPATGTEGGDAQAIGKCEAWDDIPHLAGIEIFNKSAPELVRRVLGLCLTENYPIVFVEGGGYQKTLIQWFEELMHTQQVQGITVLEVPPAGRKKNPHIAAALKILQAGQTTISPQAKTLLFSEINNWNPLVKDNIDNCLDVLRHCQDTFLTRQGEILAAQHILGLGYEQSPAGELIEVSFV